MNMIRCSALCLAGAIGVGVTCMSAPVSADEPVIAEDRFYAADFGAFDLFGSCVDIRDNLAVVGSPRDDDGGQSGGSAHVFEFEDGAWVHKAKLLPSDPSASNQFGTSVAVADGYVVVGAPFGDHGTANSGAAYVFERPETGWTDMTETAQLVATDASQGDLFGQSLDASGKLVAVGAPQDLSSGVGKVYVFLRPFNGWTSKYQDARLGYSAGSNGDRLGHCVAVAPDVIVAGGPGIDLGITNSGAGLVYEKPVEGWRSGFENAILTASLPKNGDGLGGAADIDIVNGTVVLGAPARDGTYSDVGGGYVFLRPVEGWSSKTEDALLQSSTPAILDELGYSVAIDRNLIVLGCHKDDSGGNNTGSAHAYVQPKTGWTNTNESYIVEAENPSNSDGMGTDVSIWNYRTLIGAPFDDDKGTDAGTVMSIDLTPPCMQLDVFNLIAGQTATIVVRNGDPGEEFIVLWGLGGYPTTFRNVLGYCATFDFGFISQQNIMGSGVVDENSIGLLEVPIRDDFIGFTLIIQAAKKNTCPDECMSNFVRQLVE